MAMPQPTTADRGGEAYLGSKEFLAMTSSRLLTFIAAATLCLAAGAQERIAPNANERVVPAGRATAAEGARANEMGAAAATEAPARSAGHGLLMGRGSFGGVSSTQSPTLEGAVGSGARIPGTTIVRKTCPPGLQNRDGNCVPPIEGIMGQ
jgi:hypothetical protein